MMSQPLGDTDLLRLEQADYRRITLLTAWTLVWLYVLGDLLFRWGQANDIQLVQRVDVALPASGVWQVIIFGGGLIAIWLVHYMRDDLVEQASEQSLSYRLGNTAHVRAFNIVYMCAMLLAAVAALHYRLTDLPFWLVFTILLISCLINFVERGVWLQQRASWNGMRLRLLFHRLPLIGGLISLRPINERLESGQATTNAAADPATEEAPAASTAPVDSQQPPP